MTKEQEKIFEALNDIDLILARLKFITMMSIRYVDDSDKDESKLDMGNAVNNYSDCIEMYLARLEAAKDQAWKGYHEMRAAGNESKPRGYVTAADMVRGKAAE